MINERRIGKEEYAIYTGPSSPAFSPQLAGITWPFPFYEIHRSSGGCYVFEYVISGQGQIIQDQETCHVKAGDAYILRPGHYQHYWADPKDPWKKVWLNVEGSMVRHMLSDYGLDDTLVIPDLGDGSYLFSIVDMIQKDPVHCGKKLPLLLHQYISFLSDFLGHRSLEKSPALAMKNFIEENLTAPIRIDDIADSVHLSRSRCIHLFREAYRITPYNYYLSMKLELAQSMLYHTNLSIQIISERLGFPCYEHFSAFFKKQTGISPAQYRKRDVRQ